jgi:hypothetical protein
VLLGVLVEAGERVMKRAEGTPATWAVDWVFGLVRRLFA